MLAALRLVGSEALGMLVVAVGSGAAQPKFAIDLRVDVEALGSVSARREVLALLSRVEEGALLVRAVWEEPALNKFTFTLSGLSFSSGA